MRNLDNEQYVLSLSYGKDSLACLEACRMLGQRIDRIVHAEVWATDDIPADLPPMVEFKKKADAIIKERYGLEVEHVCAMRKAVFPQTLISGMENLHTRHTSTPNRRDETTMSSQECTEVSRCKEEVGARNSNTASGLEKVTYEKLFYRLLKPTSKTYQWRMRGGQRPINGFAQIKGNWCTGLKTSAIRLSATTKRELVHGGAEEKRGGYP